MDEGDVGFAHAAVGEHFAELAVGGVVFGDEDDAAGLLVEAMDDAGAQVAVDCERLLKWRRRALTSVPWVRSFGSACSGSGVDHHAGGLVDDGEVVVFVDDVERDVFGEGVEGFGARGAFDLDGLAADELLFGLGGLAVDADLAGFDEELDAGAGDVGDGLGEVLVEAQVWRRRGRR